MNILVANVGSTSFKYRLFDMPSERVLAEGRIERVGESNSAFEHRAEGRDSVQGEAEIPDYAAAIRHALTALTGPGGSIRGLRDLAAVGFKTVHLRGEPGSYPLTDEVLGRMADYNDLAPAHNPPYIRAIRIFREVAPGVPLVGVFEPAFHATIPDYAHIYGVPYRWYERYGIRKYGFHGASHRYVAGRVPRLLGVPAEGLRIVSCHLGGSASVCAIRDGRSIDTSMGFSPQDGVLNATRTGAVDPFAVLYAMDREGLSTAEARRALSEEGGLLGISGVSGDVRDLEEAAGRGHDRARLALEAFCYGVKKQIGAYAAAMGGLDAVAFAGGIGEKGVEVRRRICAGLEFLGVVVDNMKNRSGAPERLISADGGRVKVFVIRTDEEVVVARATAEVIAR
ncbi:MAG: hypothetical protein A3F84_05270 [Candidatus Handelsmanbacteria bacterium RIFCSPLOWO2_12_FULL_64_10]|uniref:Acetate kinase n=1 Tax=Handelsmanbacteria sp. (strain RIFCSPLOWO2_12_FULL_64_10) TaxID=1817868 RepID=A0A1F6CB98_HANXR|nr:MAG: hypothetical protein A3F84_05270 [Candidatus Handelsmanbacteria bacterium RIFCSPLOWO2_12_FULL_64_10]